MDHHIISITLIAVFFTITDARTIAVGPQRSVKTLCDAANQVQPFDTVAIDSGLYVDQACIWKVSNTVIRGVKKYAHLKAPSNIPNQKAILVISGENTIIENLEFSEASVPDKNGAGIRLEGRNVIIRNCFFHDCEDGILGGSGSVLIEYSEFASCGFGDGYSHNMYIAACDSFTLRFCYTHGAREGHTIKSRAYKNYILYNLITSDTSTTSYEINLPNAGTSFIIGNCIQQGANTHNSSIIDYGSEGLANHDSALYIVNNTIVNDRNSGKFISLSNTENHPFVYNNLFVGSGTICNTMMDSAGNVTTTTPNFVNAKRFDYHLTASSPGIDKGKVPGMTGEFPLIPQYQYSADCSGVPRLISGNAPDAGAFEFSTTQSNSQSPLHKVVYENRNTVHIEISPSGIHFRVPKGTHSTYINLFDCSGRIIARTGINQSNGTAFIATEDIVPNVYVYRISNVKCIIAQGRVFINSDF